MCLRRTCILATLICQLSFRPILAAPPPNHVAGVPINDESRDFARHLAVEGDTVVVGNRTGVQVCERDPADDIWESMQTIELTGEILSVGLAGRWIAIGIKDDEYRVELYRAAEEEWVLGQTLTVPDNVECEFGSSVAISDEWLAVGAPESLNANSQSGGVYVYSIENNHWKYVDTLRNVMPALGEQFGIRVKIADSRLTVGMADREELSMRGLYAGVYVYALDNNLVQLLNYLEPGSHRQNFHMILPERSFAVTSDWAALGGLSTDGCGVIFILNREDRQWRLASRVQEPRPSFTSLGYLLDGNANMLVAAAMTDRHQQSLHMYLNEHEGMKFVGSLEGLRMDDRTSIALAVSDKYIVATGVVPYGDEVHSAVLAWPIPTALYTTPEEIDSMSREELMRYLGVVTLQKAEWSESPGIANRLNERYDRAFQKVVGNN